MNPQLIEQALAVVPSKQLLINIVSKRVRQLMAGSRPLIDNHFRMGLADIALTEIAGNKIEIIEDTPAVEVFA